MLLDVWSAIGSQYIYMVNGFAGQVQRLDLNGMAAVGRTGKGEGEFGEAHLIAVSPKGGRYKNSSRNNQRKRGIYRASGFGRIWNLTILPFVPLPPSTCQTKCVP
jgi:hypothetical protein